jgi:transcriptional regulator with XRE-family HTH domain
MITGRQIRAARGLMRWRVEDLAKKAGLTREAITRMEDGSVQPREGSIAKIIRAFDQNGLEFIDNQGVRFKPNDIEVFEGPDRFEDFTDFVCDHMKQYGGDVCISAVDEGQFAKHRKDPENYRKRMKELVDSGNVRVRILATWSKFTSSFAQFKWQPQQQGVTPTSFYAFGKCLALISFAQEPPPYVVLHKSGPFAEAYKHAFEIAWENAKEPPKTEAKA